MSFLKPLLLTSVGLIIAISAQAKEDLPPLRVGHPDLLAGCADAASQSDPAWTAYLDLLSTRLARPVLGCGMDAAQAKDALENKELDFALAEVASLEDGQATSIRPILRIRSMADSPRTEMVVVSHADEPLSDGDNLSSAEHTQIIGWTRIDMLHGTAIIERAFADHPSVTAIVDDHMSRHDEWIENEPNTDPKAAITGLADNESPHHLLMRLGRFTDLCSAQESLCEDLEVTWRGFPPISTAFAVSPEVDPDLRYRLIGIHFSMHLAHSEMMEKLAGAKNNLFEPTDPHAFKLENTL